MEKNELKNFREEIKSSIENLEGRISGIDALASERLALRSDIQERDELKKELRRQKLDFAIVDWMIRMEEKVEKMGESEEDRRTYYRSIPPMPAMYPYSQTEWEKDYLSQRQSMAMKDFCWIDERRDSDNPFAAPRW